MKNPKFVFSAGAILALCALLVGCYITDTTFADLFKLIFSSYMSSPA